MRIVLDAMGGDEGATPWVEGAVLAARRLNCDVVLVGRQHSLGRLLRHFRYKGDRITIQPAGQVVHMGEHPSDSLAKKDSSIAVGARLVHEGRGDALRSPRDVSLRFGYNGEKSTRERGRTCMTTG